MQGVQQDSLHALRHCLATNEPETKSWGHAQEKASDVGLMQMY